MQVAQETRAAGAGLGEELVVEAFDAERPHRFEALDGRDAEAIVVACAVPYLLLRSYM